MINHGGKHILMSNRHSSRLTHLLRGTLVSLARRGSLWQRCHWTCEPPAEKQLGHSKPVTKVLLTHSLVSTSRLTSSDHHHTVDEPLDTAQWVLNQYNMTRATLGRRWYGFHCSPDARAPRLEPIISALNAALLPLRVHC